MLKKSLFLIEGSYCGIFTIENANKEILEKILLIECPEVLFPFLKSILANAHARRFPTVNAKSC